LASLQSWINSGGDDRSLRDLLGTLSPSARGHLRDVLIRDRPTVTPSLHNYSATGMSEEPPGANLVDRLSLDPALRRQYVRLLGELEAED